MVLVDALSLEVQPTAAAVAERAADLIVTALRAKPTLVLCCAAGATPTATYAVLAKRRAAEPAAFAALRVLKLDEWCGLPPSDEGGGGDGGAASAPESESPHPCSCEAYLR
jgi:6-phosphogluconolactonase/glucosamine-6-phosphate isomerase/deaminase